MKILGDGQLCKIILDDLVSRGKLDERQSQIALASENPYEDILRHVSHTVIAETISGTSGDPLFTDMEEADDSTMRNYEGALSNHGAFAIEQDDVVLKVGVSSTLDSDYLNAIEADLRRSIGEHTVKFYIVPVDVLKSITRKTSLGGGKEGNVKSMLDSLAEDQTDITTVGSTWRDTLAGRALIALIKEALGQGTSDIHIRARSERESEIRYRVDGSMADWYVIKVSAHLALGAVIKASARLNISSQNSEPQDGSIKLNQEIGEKITVRVSINPTMYNERIVLRLINSGSGENVSLSELGILDSELTEIRRGLTYTSGMVLVTGPTGSGKNTTLYGMLHEIKDPRKTFLSAEDPIEAVIGFMDQTEVDGINITFPSALRAMLRQDPDVIMLTEIRDNETAGIALKAASTGHLLFTTLHTNNTTDTVLRITKMGIDNLDVARTTNLFIAQRLAKKLCKHCRVKVKVTAELLLEHLPVLDIEEVERRGFVDGDAYLTNHNGCGKCGGTGTSGRCPVVEVVFIDSTYSEYLLKMDLVAFEKRLQDQGKDMLASALKRTQLGLIGLDTIASILSK